MKTIDSRVVEAAQQADGENVVTFAQTRGATWKWGVTEISVTEASPAPLALALTEAIEGQINA